jgi:drug/metabolite transporter (DMT)-like permease
MVRAYQIADATRVSVIEYTILPASAVWSWVIWGEVLSPIAVLGMVMIVAAGVWIALSSRK